jgi:hypothetical protein
MACQPSQYFPGGQKKKQGNNQGKTMPWKARDFTGAVLPRQTPLRQAHRDFIESAMVST